MTIDRRSVANAVLRNAIEWRKHALRRMLERNISRSDAQQVLLSGEIIEEYLHSKPYPSALFFGLVDGRPLHVVAAFDSDAEKVYVLTVYEPSLEKFEKDFKTRRR